MRREEGERNWTREGREREGEREEEIEIERESEKGKKEVPKRKLEN